MSSLLILTWLDNFVVVFYDENTFNWIIFQARILLQAAFVGYHRTVNILNPSFDRMDRFVAHVRPRFLIFGNLSCC